MQGCRVILWGEKRWKIREKHKGIKSLYADYTDAVRTVVTTQSPVGGERNDHTKDPAILNRLFKFIF